MEFNISRYKNIEKKTYDCEVVTPMFLAGADQKEAELRTQSIKGDLRFWWRALYGSDNIEDMKKRESEVFGDTEKKSKTKIMLSNVNTKESLDKLHKSGFHTLNYMAYGYDDNKGNIRKYILPGSTFEFSVLFCNEIYKQLENVINVFLQFGGLGSKSRNGFGSIYCKNIKVIDIAGFFKGELKNFTAFSKESKCFDDFYEKNSWEDALVQMGDLYKNSKKQMKDSRIDRALISKPFKNDKSRYGKSYFFHIDKTVSGKYKGKILFLPHVYQNEGVNQEEYMSAYKFLNEKILGGGK